MTIILAGLPIPDGDKGDITVSGSLTSWSIDNDVVTNAKAANMAEATAKMRAVGAGTGDPIDGTPDQLSTMLDTATDPFLRTSAATGGASVLVQQVNTQVTASNTGTGTIPIDNTKPQSGEGTEFMTLAVTPTSASNKLRIDVVCFVVNSIINQWMMVALFQDAGADALATQLMWQPAVNSGCPICFTYFMVAGTTSATTFKVRAGANLAGTTYFNRLSSGNYMDGTITSSITITEIAV